MVSIDVNRPMSCNLAC